MLLDEPSAGLNRDEREDLARFILRIKHELGLPMIWIEHDMQMVADLADRIHVLDYGRTLAAGPPERFLIRACCAYLGSSVALTQALLPSSERRSVQHHRGANERFQRRLIDVVVLMDIDGAPGYCLRGWS